jgi:hypothetical protein
MADFRSPSILGRAEFLVDRVPSGCVPKDQDD